MAKVETSNSDRTVSLRLQCALRKNNITAVAYPKAAGCFAKRECLQKTIRIQKVYVVFL